MRLLRIAAIFVLLLAGCGRATPVTPSATPTAALTATQTAASTATPAPTLPPPTATAAPSPTPASAVPGLVKLAELGKGSISPVFRSPDGKRVIVGGIDGTVRWYEADTGKEQGAIDPFVHNLLINATFSPDSSIVALETLFGLMVMELNTGKLIAEVDGIYSVQKNCIFSPDSQYIAFVNSHHTSHWSVDSIQVIRLDSDGEIEQLPTVPVEGETDDMDNLEVVTMSQPSISPDGSMIVSGGSDRYVYIWDAERAEIRHALAGHADEVRSTAFSADGKLLASLDRAGTVRLWEPFEGKPLQAFSSSASAYSRLAFDADGMIRLSGGEKLTPSLLNPFTGTVTPLQPEPTPTPDPFEVDLHQQGYLTKAFPSVENVTLSPDGSEIAAASRNILLWDRESMTLKHSIELEQSVNSLVYSPDGTRLAVSLEYAGIRVLDTISGAVVFSPPAEDPLKPHAAFQPAFSPDGKQVAFGIQNRIEIWDIASGEQIKSIQLHGANQFASQVGFSADGSRLYNILNSNDAGQVWDITSGKLLNEVGNVDNRSLSGGLFSASDLQPPYFARNYSHEIEASIEVWNLDTGQVVRTPTESGSNVPHILSLDGSLLFTRDYNRNELWIVDTSTGDIIYSRPFPSIGAIDFRPDLGLIASLKDGVLDLLDTNQVLSAARENSHKVLAIDPIAKLYGFTGEWSPTDTVLAGMRRDEEAKGHLTVASAPDYIPAALLPDFIYTESMFGHEVTWKPDGSWIMLGGPAGLGEIGEASALWAVKPSGDGARRFLENAPAMIRMNIPGWLDDSTLILASHMGGDTWQTRLVDFESGKVLAQANILGTVFPGRPSGAPFAHYFSGARVGLLTSAQQGESLTTNSHTVRLMPENDRLLPPEDRIMHVLGWRPGVEKLLVAVETMHINRRSLEATQVMEWDLLTDTTALLAPKAGYAEYSPDGQWLALLSYGELALNANQTINRNTSSVVDEHEGNLLYLVDTADGTVKLDMPVDTDLHCCGETQPYQTPRTAFSPDGRYLAFVSYGPVRLNPGPFDKEQISTGQMLNVLDLETFQIIHSVPFTDDFLHNSAMAWSPTGENLYYVAYRYGPAVLNIRSGTTTELNVYPDSFIETVEWSHDGVYISVRVRLDDNFYQYSVKTLIYKID